jgi:hypothetical protein
MSLAFSRRSLSLASTLSSVFISIYSLDYESDIFNQIYIESICLNIHLNNTQCNSVQGK